MFKTIACKACNLLRQEDRFPQGECLLVRPNFRHPRNSQIKVPRNYRLVRSAPFFKIYNFGFDQKSRLFGSRTRFWTNLIKKYSKKFRKSALSVSWWVLVWICGFGWVRILRERPLGAPRAPLGPLGAQNPGFLDFRVCVCVCVCLCIVL